MKRLIYKGFIKERTRGENEKALFIGDMEFPLSEEFKEKLQDKQVSVRYWISDFEKNKKKIKEDALLNIIGLVNAEYYDRYSELTGYLWTDAELKIGGHDLLRELLSYKEKFIYLEIDVH